ncbi:pleckstrin homology domain-containing family G member 3 isoform X5 [Silurus meridionalis]|uniref:pleckstrin homology domain-containing family G member 3 isoform X5 n=1 Tax=Silurus meridionalis TaxID=175797 RepID=UPI001EEAFB5D|nr:pleckstrin homology domain-containing family G member 3 isoform X5 [Silurus meridionalis]
MHEAGFGEFHQVQSVQGHGSCQSVRSTLPQQLGCVYYICTPPPLLSFIMAPNPELSYLDRVVMEIMETERVYVEDLHSIVEGYLAHIIDTAALPLLPEHVCALFGNIEDIYEFNSELLQELDLCKNDPVGIARCFVLKRDYFEIYTQYCTNYPNSVAALTECMRNKTLLTFFMERQEALQHPLPLGSYLLKPVQRILKYHLLLQEIAKHFDPDGEGYDVVEEAINTMTEVAWYINTMKRKHEHAVRLQEVQSLLINWRGPDLTTYGELVLEGTFRFHHAKNNRTLFLFERILLITKRRGENFIYKTQISCSMLMLMEGTKDSLCFSVTHYKHPKQPHTVQTRTMEEKKLWTHHIKRLILENHHTTIPQKAKEVILEMDPMYQKYRFNSERKKKTQSDDFTHTRQSEITKQMLKTNKGMLKDEEWQEHGDSQLSQQEERQASPNILEFQNNTAAELGSANESKPISDCDRAKIIHCVYHMSAVEKSDKYEVKEDIVLNQDGQSSEEEVEDDCVESQNHSILPSSVLDKAGVIAEHFIANARHSSAGPDELRSPQHIHHEVSSREELVSGSNQNVCRRRDSTLSKQERLLIDKIRNYYENAEQQDEGFSLKRRESLAYIPSGLVRTSVNHFNKIPHTDHRKTSITETSLVTSADSDISTEPDQLQDVLSIELNGSQAHKPEEFPEEHFCSSTEMLKVWQEMEKEVMSSVGGSKFREMSLFKGPSSFSQRNKGDFRGPELIAADDLSTIIEESPVKGKEEGNEKESKENAVLSLKKLFSHHIQSEEASPQSWRRSSDTSTSTVNKTHIPLLADEQNKSTCTGKPSLKLPLTCVWTTQEVQRTHTSPSSSVSVLSADCLKSPVPLESFSWPDVSELRSIYSSLDCVSHTPLTSAAHTHSPGCSLNNKASRIHRAGSLDQKLGGFGWTNLPNKKVNSDYCISGQAMLPNNKTITVLEKVKTQTLSPTSREKQSLLSVTERCRLYEDLDEAALRSEPESRNKDNKSDKRGNSTQQGVVKNLREKFLNLK